MANKRYYEEKKQERKDGGMLNYDMSAVANMPQQVKYHAWPSANNYMSSNFDDTITGINKQIGEDEAGAKRYLKNNKW